MGSTPEDIGRQDWTSRSTVRASAWSSRDPLPQPRPGLASQRFDRVGHALCSVLKNLELMEDGFDLRTLVEAALEPGDEVLDRPLDRCDYALRVCRVAEIALQMLEDLGALHRGQRAVRNPSSRIPGVHGFNPFARGLGAPGPRSGYLIHDWWARPFADETIQGAAGR